MTRAELAALAKALAPILVQMRGKDGVNGKDGERGTDGIHGRDGRDGKDGAMGLAGKDGAPGLNGKDGVDGLGIDDADLVHDQRGWFLRLINTAANRVKDLQMPFLWDAKVWVMGATYPKGAGVTWDGQYWIAQKETSVKPDEGVEDWRLAVRRGGRGKDGKPGKDFTPRGSNTPPLYG